MLDSDSAQWPYLLAWFIIALPLSYIGLYFKLASGNSLLKDEPPEKKFSFTLIFWSIPFAAMTVLGAAIAAGTTAIVVLPLVLLIDAITGGNINKSDLMQFADVMLFAIPLAIACAYFGVWVVSQSAEESRAHNIKNRREQK